MTENLQYDGRGPEPWNEYFSVWAEPMHNGEKVSRGIMEIFMNWGIQSLHFSQRETTKHCAAGEAVSLNPAIYNLTAQFCQEMKADNIRPIFRPQLCIFLKSFCSDKREHYDFIRLNLLILNPSHHLKSLKAGQAEGHSRTEQRIQSLDHVCLKMDEGCRQALYWDPASTPDSAMPCV